MAKKVKQEHKSKDELLKELVGKKEFQEKMAFARGKFFPAVCEASTSIDDALMFLASFNSIIMETVLGWMKDRKFNELELIFKLDPQDERFEKFKTMLELFDDMSVFDAKDMIEGMKREIQLWQTEWAKTHKIEDLPRRWIDEL